MSALAQDFWHEQEDDPIVRIDGRIDAAAHEAYWQSVYWSQPYFRSELDYEDYAPAYCVGYCGYAQYGGSYDDAEKSLCANWVRIQGGSRLTFDEAQQAIRAAWRHAERAEAAELAADEDFAQVPAMAQSRATAQPAYAAA